MQLIQEKSLKHLGVFLNKIEEKRATWRLISIEFQDSEMLHSLLFEKLCAKSLESCFEESDCRIFWVKPGFILVFFQGRALPIEKCIEEFFKETEFQGFGRFFDILDLSIHWDTLTALIDRIKKSTGQIEPTQKVVEPEQVVTKVEGFKIELSKQRIEQMKPVRKSRSRRLVLLVEDDPFTQQLVKLAIKDQFEVIAAETARQALAYYQRHLPDMVFLDIQLPDGNGINLLEQITGADSDAYIFMLSSHSQKEKILECQNLGAKGFIGKPFTRQLLVDAISKFQSTKVKSFTTEGRHGT